MIEFTLTPGGPLALPALDVPNKSIFHSASFPYQERKSQPGCHPLPTQLTNNLRFLSGLDQTLTLEEAPGLDTVLGKNLSLRSVGALRIMKECFRSPSMFIMEPAFTNSPQKLGAENTVTSFSPAKYSYPSSTTWEREGDRSAGQRGAAMALVQSATWAGRNLVGAAEQVEAVAAEELWDHFGSEEIGEAPHLQVPSWDLLAGIRPEKVAEKARRRDVGRAGQVPDLIEVPEHRREPAVEADDLAADDGRRRQAVEAGDEQPPQSRVESRLAFVAEAPHPRHGVAVVVPPQEEEAVWIPDLVGQKEAHRLHALPSPSAVVPQEQVPPRRREPAAVEESQKIKVLPVDVPCRETLEGWSVAPTQIYQRNRTRMGTVRGSLGFREARFGEEDREAHRRHGWGLRAPEDWAAAGKSWRRRRRARRSPPPGSSAGTPPAGRAGPEAAGWLCCPEPRHPFSAGLACRSEKSARPAEQITLELGGEAAPRGEGRGSSSAAAAAAQRELRVGIHAARPLHAPGSCREGMRKRRQPTARWASLTPSYREESGNARLDGLYDVTLGPRYAPTSVDSVTTVKSLIEQFYDMRWACSNNFLKMELKNWNIYLFQWAYQEYPHSENISGREFISEKISHHPHNLAIIKLPYIYIID